ncbi:hypothetical protein LCGC14_3146770, partial [marine sediment metagenome]
DKDPRRDLQTGEKLWIRAAGPMVDYLYDSNILTAITKNYVDTVSGSIGQDLNHQILELYAYVDTVSGSGTQSLQGTTDIGNVTTNPLLVQVSGSTFSTLTVFGNTIIGGVLDIQSHKVINVADPTAAQDAATKIYVDAPMEAMKEPTGFPNRTDSALTFTDGTRTLDISATDATFDYWIKGIKYTIANSSVVITDTEGQWFFYLNSSGNLVATQTFVEEDIYFNNAYTAVVYWDATNNTAIYLGDERHGITMDGQTHNYLHDTTGTKFESGLSLNTFDSDGSGNDATAAQFGYAAGVIWDQDIEHSISADTAPAQIPIYYKLGAGGDWRKTTVSDYP